jgi:predicted thioesterase
MAVLDRWLEENEGTIAKEVRVRHAKHWRCE